MKPKFWVEITKEGLKWKDPDRLKVWLGQFVGQTMQVVISKPKDIRSLNQNKLYWKYLEFVEAETGNEQEDLHEYFKRKFLPPRWIKTKWEDLRVPASTTKLDKKEFTDYLSKIERLTGVPVPTNEWE